MEKSHLIKAPSPRQFSLTRQIGFKASHSYNQEKFSAEVNEKFFGSTVNEHSHDYVLEITITGDVDPDTGMIMNLSDIDMILDKVVAPLNEKYINKDVPDFLNVIPTTENLAHFFHIKVTSEIAALQKSKTANTHSGTFAASLSKTRLYESPQLFAEFKTKS